MFIQDRNSARRFFIDIWNKYLQKRSLEPLEQRVLAVILEHSEYHEILSDPQSALAEEYSPEEGRSNPFLHMGMHIAIKEQVSSDRPSGISGLYRTLLENHAGDQHCVEHLMLECLGESLWTAQRNSLPPDEQAYLDCLRKLR